MPLASTFTSCLSRLLGAVAVGLASTSACMAAAAVCSQLESQLSTVGRSQGGGYQQYTDAANRQRNELAMAQGAAQQAGCFGGFLFFMPQPSARCGSLMANVDRMQANLARLEQMRDQYSGGGNSADRMRVLQALGDYQCGPQYAPYASGRSGFFGFGGAPGYPPPSPYPTQSSPPSGRGNYRTLCVRSCDGYYFPISDQTSSSRFQTDQAVCQSLCPGSSVELYVHENPGQQSEDMVSLKGTPYASQPFAFLYRQSYNPACTCNPASKGDGVAGAAGFTPVPRVAVAGVIADQSLDTATTAVIPVPTPKPDPAADPETLGNALGGFTPVPVTPKPNAAVAAAAAAQQGIRVVGPSYSYLTAPAVEPQTAVQANPADPSDSANGKGP